MTPIIISFLEDKENRKNKIIGLWLVKGTYKFVSHQDMGLYLANIICAMVNDENELLAREAL